MKDRWLDGMLLELFNLTFCEPKSSGELINLFDFMHYLHTDGKPRNYHEIVLT